METVIATVKMSSSITIVEKMAVAQALIRTGLLVKSIDRDNLELVATD